MDQNTLLRLPANVDGRKTYLFAALIGGGAALLWLFGAADSKEALIGLLNAGALAALRHALAKLPADQQANLERAIELYRSATQRLQSIGPSPDRQADLAAGHSKLQIYPPPSADA